MYKLTFKDHQTHKEEKHLMVRAKSTNNRLNPFSKDFLGWN
jgi:hypothetical protein